MSTPIPSPAPAPVESEYAAPRIAAAALVQMDKWAAFLEALRNPAFAGWDRVCATSSVQHDLVQFFPPSAELEHRCAKEAARIARVLGGCWMKRGDKWEAELDGRMRGLHVVLHRVEPPPVPAPDGPVIDLNRYPEGEA